MHDPNAVKIYTDGSAIPNPGQGGIGIVVEYPDSFTLDNVEISEGYFESTNNRMELIACITALRWLRENESFLKITRAIIITDSDYLYSNYGYAQYWKKDNWINQYGKPYENKDIWDLFLRERQKIHFHNEIKWEKGKTKPVLNRVDSLAKQGAKNPTKKDFGFQTGKFTASRSNNKKGAMLYPANNQEEIIRVYKKNIYGKNEKELYKISFDIYSKAENKFTGKYFAYKAKECITLERNNCYKIKFNDEPNYPFILEAKPVKYPKILIVLD
jgi:ribonuclease HI